MYIFLQQQVKIQKIYNFEKDYVIDKLNHS
jgi:hypothetical protein